MAAEQEWVDQAIRLYRRYERETVDACGFCPWAQRVRRDGRLVEIVLLQDDESDLDPTLAALAGLSKDTDLALFIYPRLLRAREPFERFAARVRDADTARNAPRPAPFVSVVFHPQAEPHLEDGERLIPFLRRTPDATLQFVRSTVLEKVRGSSTEGTQFVDPTRIPPGGWQPQPPSLRERVAQTNLETTLRLGVDTLRRAYDDILRDRDETYGRLAAT